MKLLRIKLPDSLHARLKVQCAIAEPPMSMQHAASEAIKGWVEYCASLKINPALASANPQKRGL